MLKIILSVYLSEQATGPIWFAIFRLFLKFFALGFLFSGSISGHPQICLRHEMIGNNFLILSNLSVSQSSLCPGLHGGKSLGHPGGQTHWGTGGRGRWLRLPSFLWAPLRCPFPTCRITCSRVQGYLPLKMWLRDGIKEAMSATANLCISHVTHFPRADC